MLDLAASNGGNKQPQVNQSGQFATNITLLAMPLVSAIASPYLEALTRLMLRVRCRARELFCIGEMLCMASLLSRLSDEPLSN